MRWLLADCVEFYDDWGWGDSVKLDVYYRMCDQLVKAAKADKDLMAVDARRFLGEWGQNSDSLYPDPEKHILAFDLIYCCSTYGLFKGITFERPKTKDRQMMNQWDIEKVGRLQYRFIQDTIGMVFQWDDLFGLELQIGSRPYT